jgi:CheY-like chemotaxis protein
MLAMYAATNHESAIAKPTPADDGALHGKHSSHGQLRVLLLEDSPADVELITLALQQNGFSVLADVAQTPQEFLERIGNSSYDMILADYNLPEWRGMEALVLMREQGLEIPLILVTGSLGDVTAVECIKQGATDYVLKDGLARR